MTNMRFSLLALIGFVALAAIDNVLNSAHKLKRQSWNW
jgi:hypothetical protein